MRYALAILCALAVVSAQVLYGGAMRPVFALPALGLAGLAGALGLASVFWRNVPAPSPLCVGSVFALAGWLIWRCLGSPDVWLAEGYLRLILGCLVMYLLFAAVLTNPFHRLAFLGVLLAAAVVEGLGAVWQFARPETGPMIPWFSEQLRLWYEVGANRRGHGTFLSANHLVWSLNAMGLMALALTCWGRWGLKSKLVCFWLALIVLVGGIFTLSRGGAIALGVGLAVFLFLSAVALFVGARDRRWVALLAVVGVAAVVASGVFFAYENSFRVKSRFDELLQGSYREEVFDFALRQTQLEPLFGTGAGTFQFISRGFRETWSRNDDIYAHNDWAQLAADFGLPAFFLALLVVGFHTWTGFGSLKEILRRRMTSHSRPQSHAAAIQLGALAGLGVFAMHSFFDFNMHIPANALLAAALVGLLANPGLPPERGTTRAGAVFRRFTCLVCGGAAVILSILTWAAAPQELAWLEAENAALRGQSPQAIAWAQTGLEMGAHGQLERVLGEVYLREAVLSRDPRGQRAWAAAALLSHRKAVDLAPMDSWRYLQVAEAAHLLGADREAEKAVLQFLQLGYPLSGRGFELYGEILESRGELAVARSAYRQATSLAGATHARASARKMDAKIRLLNQ